jgi:flavin reductase (DIM6/NTAB) family NADH-FMN oxidoreductase RutF
LEIDPRPLSRKEKYFLSIACVVPRPIGWTSTLSAVGAANLAPFSYFGGVSSDPPVVSLSVGRRRGGARKDTANNLIETGEAVVHIADRALAGRMVATSADVPPEVDEFELVGLEKIPSRIVKPYRVAGAPIAMETRLIAHHDVANVDLFLLEVLLFHVEDRLLVGGLPDPVRLDAVGRMGGETYCSTTGVFDIGRP